MPLFSVVVPCRNAASTLPQTLQSVRDQTLADWECILVDDASTDETAQIMAAFTEVDSRFRMVQGTELGPSRARNVAAIEHASGRYVAFLDGDDLWAPERLAVFRDVLSEVGAPELVYSTVEFFSTDAGRVEAYSRPPTGDLTAFQILADNPVCTTSNVVVDRALFAASGGFDPSLVHCEDQEWLARIALAGARLRAVQRPLLSYRTSSGGLSANLDAMREGFEVVLARTVARGLVLSASQRGALRACNLRYLARRALRVGTPRGIALRLALRGLIAGPTFLLPLRRGLPTLVGAGLHALSPSAVHRLQRTS